MHIFISKIIIMIFGAWLIGVSVFAILRPLTARAYIGKFASSLLINFAELIPRAIIGIAFILVASVSSSPMIYTIIGWGLFISAIILMIIPRHWHASYSIYWSKNLPIWCIYLCAPMSCIAGAYLIFTSLL